MDKLKQRIEDFITKWPVAFLFFMALLLHLKQLSLYRITSLDTFNITTVNFIFMSDALKSGNLPLWNPFVLAGIPFFGSVVFSSALFSPINLFLLLNSLWLNPIWLVEVMLLIATFIGGLGFYFFLKEEKVISQNVRLIFACAFMFVILMPNMGQIYFVYSFACLPWLLYATKKILDQGLPTTQVIFLAILISFIMSNGYFYFNFVNCIFCSTYFILKFPQNFKWKALFQFCLFILFVNLLYLILNIEGMLHSNAIFESFQGDFIIKEPRMRTVGKVIKYFYDSWNPALKALLLNDFETSRWTYGLDGFILFLVFIFLNFKEFFRRNRIGLGLFLIALFFFGLYFSIKSDYVTLFFDKAPLFKSFRWCFTNLNYALIALLFASAFCADRFFEVSFRWTTFVIIFSLSLAFIRNESQLVAGDNINRDFKLRNINTEITRNERNTGHSFFYQFNDWTWLKQKIPFTHGYNNSTSPFFWEMKDLSFLEKMVDFTRNVKAFQMKKREDFVSDQDYVESNVAQVDPTGKEILISMERGEFQPVELQDALREDLSQSIQSIKIKNNTAYFELNAKRSGFLIFYNNWNKNWSAKINGVSTPIFKANLIFQAVFVNEGLNQVEFNYFSPSFIILLGYYFVIFLFFLIVFFLKYRRKLKNDY